MAERTLTELLRDTTQQMSMRSREEIADELDRLTRERNQWKGLTESAFSDIMRREVATVRAENERLTREVAELRQSRHVLTLPEGTEALGEPPRTAKVATVNDGAWTCNRCGFVGFWSGVHCGAGATPGKEPSPLTDEEICDV